MTLEIQDRLLALYFSLDTVDATVEQLSAAGAVGFALGSMADPEAMASPADQVIAARASLIVSANLVGTRDGFYDAEFLEALEAAADILDSFQE